MPLNDISNALLASADAGVLKSSSDAAGGPSNADSSITSKTSLSKGDKLALLAEDLSSHGNAYALSGTCMMFLDRILAGKRAAHSTPDLNMESAAQSRFLDSMDAFQRETHEYECALKELNAAKKFVKDREESIENTNFVMASGRDIQSELKQSESVLLGLQEQQNKVDEIVAIKRMKLDQAQVSLELSVEDGTKQNSSDSLDSFRRGGKFGMKNSAEEKEFLAAMKKVQDQRDNAEALLEGLRVLTGIQSISVPQDMVRLHSNRLSSNNFNAAKSIKAEHVLPVTVEVGDITAVLMLDDKLHLTSIEVTSGEIELDGEGFNREKRRSLSSKTPIAVNTTTSDVLSQILDEANVLTAPHDLRYAIFALGCIQKSPVILRAHVSDLRKKCIVRSTGPLSAEFTLSAGVTVSLAVHKCYPNVPAGVTANSIIGVGGWTKAEIESVRNTANSLGISTVMDMFEYLQSSEAFGV
jgi:hypothetical protein